MDETKGVSISSGHAGGPIQLVLPIPTIIHNDVTGLRTLVTSGSLLLRLRPVKTPKICQTPKTKGFTSIPFLVL